MDMHKKNRNDCHEWHAWLLCLLICFYDIDVLSQSFSAESIITQTKPVALWGYTPGHLTLGASIVFENLLAITSHLVHVMDKSLLYIIVNFKYVVSAVPDTSCELLPNYYYAIRGPIATLHEGSLKYWLQCEGRNWPKENGLLFWNVSSCFLFSWAFMSRIYCITVTWFIT